MQETKTIRNYEYAMNYRDDMEIVVVHLILFILLNIILSYLFINNNTSSYILYSIWFSPISAFLLFYINKCHKFNLTKIIISIINRIFFKFDNKYANLILDRIYLYNNNDSQLYQSKVSKLLEYMQSPYANQEILNDIKELDNKTILLIDEDMKNPSNGQHLSKACFDLIYLEIGDIEKKVNISKEEYQQKQEKLEQQKEHLEQFLENLKKS